MPLDLKAVGGQAHFHLLPSQSRYRTDPWSHGDPTTSSALSALHPPRRGFRRLPDLRRGGHRRQYDAAAGGSGRCGPRRVSGRAVGPADGAARVRSAGDAGRGQHPVHPAADGPGPIPRWPSRRGVVAEIRGWESDRLAQGPGDGRRGGRGGGGRCGHRGRRFLRQRGGGGRGVCGTGRAALCGVHQRGGALGTAGPDRRTGRRAEGPPGHHRRTERGDGPSGRGAPLVPADQLLLALTGWEPVCQRGVQVRRLRAGAGLLRATARCRGGTHQPGGSAGRNRSRIPGVGGRGADGAGAPAGGRGAVRLGAVHRRAAPPGPRGAGAYASDARADGGVLPRRGAALLAGAGRAVAQRRLGRCCGRRRHHGGTPEAGGRRSDPGAVLRRRVRRGTGSGPEARRAGGRDRDGDGAQGAGVAG